MTTKYIAPCLATAALLATGCSRHLSNSNLRQIHTDMSVKEVESIMGPPTRVDSHVELPREIEVPVTHYYYDQDGKTVELVFYGDKLATGGNAISGTFGQ